MISQHNEIPPRQDERNLPAAIGELLAELTDAQGQLLQLLREKQKLLRAADLAGLQQLEGQEQALLARLQTCQDQRTSLLACARREGLPDESLASLAQRLPSGRTLQADVRRAAVQARLLQHQSLTNWVIAQRSILHISQILEILATGRPQRTSYARGEVRRAGGALLDQQG